MDDVPAIPRRKIGPLLISSSPPHFISESAMSLGEGKPMTSRLDEPVPPGHFRRQGPAHTFGWLRRSDIEDKLPKALRDQKTEVWERPDGSLLQWQAERGPLFLTQQLPLFKGSPNDRQSRDDE